MHYRLYKLFYHFFHKYNYLCFACTCTALYCFIINFCYSTMIELWYRMDRKKGMYKTADDFHACWYNKNAIKFAYEHFCVFLFSKRR